MKKYAVILSILLFFPSLPIPATKTYSASARQTKPLYAQDRILFKLKAQAISSVGADQVVDELMPSRSAQVEALSDRRSDQIHSIELRGDISVEEAVRRLSADPRIEYAEPD